MMARSTALTVFWGTWLLSQVLACKPSPSGPRAPESRLQALLASHERQRQAHLEGNAEAFVAELADTVLILQNGDLFQSPRADIAKQFKEYFATVRYTTWDDVQKPLIRFSDDSSQASVFGQKLLDGQYQDSTGAWGGHHYSLYSWDSDYRWEAGRWYLYSNTSGEKMLQEAEALALRVHTSHLYGHIPEKGLVAEGVAFDPRSQTTYLSSTYQQKILAIDPAGQVRDFKTSGEDGLWSTLGMEVDSSRNRLWVISSNAHKVMPMQNPEPDTEWTSRVYCYDLSQGALLKKYEAKISGEYCFNDLTISSSGEVFISESVQNRLYRLQPESGEFALLPVSDSAFIFPNGMTLSKDDRFLYVGYQTGIKQVRLSDDQVRDLETAEGILPHRLDGLAYYKGTLIGNQPFRKRILQFSLDEENAQITQQRILEANHPHFDQPTSGEVASDTFIYLANAQLASAFAEGILRADEELEPTYLMRVSLAHTDVK